MPLGLEALVALWPDIIAAARDRSILLGQALVATTPTAVSQGVVRLTVPAEEGMLLEGVRRQQGVVEELIAVRFTGPVRLEIGHGAGPADPAAAPKRPTAEAIKAERLDRLRRMDPALDTAADELDLEIVDEGPRSP